METTNRKAEGIHEPGYTDLMEPASGAAPGAGHKEPLNKYLQYVLICLPFTAILLLQMFADYPPLHWLMNPWAQLSLCLPVYIAGMSFFGRSALRSIASGIPNMNVLIATGTTAAFFYSLTGTILNLGPGYLFYETAASVITLVFLGYYLEDISVRSTQRALNELARSQKTMTNMIAFDDQHQELIFPIENTQLRSGDLILIRSGEQVPADCKILWGEARVNESIVTGESLPVDRQAKDLLIGGSLLLSGTVKAQVMAAWKDSILAGIINQVKQAQRERPPIQQLADKISAVFVPVVLGLAILTFLVNYGYLHAITPSLMRSIAVLVIACPCAMGLATPAAIAVGSGRAATEGILIRHAKNLESFKDIRQVIFDKTGTLTTGKFTISKWGLEPATGAPIPMGSADPEPMTAEAFKRIAFSLEKYSTHPIAKAVATEWKQKNEIRWTRIEEVKGLGMRGETSSGDVYWAASHRILDGRSALNPATPSDPAFASDPGIASGPAIESDPTIEGPHQVYIVRNDRLLGWIDLADTVRPEAAGVIQWLHAKGIRTVLLSGDRSSVTRRVAAELGIQEVYAEQSPAQKLEQVGRLNAAAPAAMVGDGINDAPALAKATIGIAMDDASQLAMQTADVVLMNHGLKHLPAALELGRRTFGTIRQNLFWAFFYNIIAIPVAALGWLTPALAALVMGLSDVILVFNSIRLSMIHIPGRIR